MGTECPVQTGRILPECPMSGACQGAASLGLGRTADVILSDNIEFQSYPTIYITLGLLCEHSSAADNERA
jgi:hypothetical protein